jgi:hypothetical protein
VDVLLWLVPTGVATVLAMLWATWAGHRQRVEARDDRRRSVADDEAARAKLGAALSKPLPRRATSVARQRSDHVSGVALRRQPARTPAAGGSGPPR